MKETKTLGQGTATQQNESVTSEIGSSYLDLAFQNQCAANVPQDLQTREFFEAFEGTSEPSVRAFAMGKRLIR